MSFQLKKLCTEDSKEAIRIFNHYIEHSMSAYPEDPVPDDFFQFFLDSSRDLPAYSVYDRDRLIGFGLLRKYSPISTFDRVAEITYFIHPEYTGKKIGESLLERLLTEGKSSGLTSVLASISSENSGSIRFHSRHGFVERGRFVGIGKKKGVEFDVVWMQKSL